MLKRLEQEDDRELLDLGVVFAEYAFEHYHADLEWLHEMVNRMKDVEDLPLFQEFARKNLEKGQLQALRSMLINIVKANMPEWADLAREQAALIEQPEILNALILKLFTAKTSTEVERYLLNWNKPARKKQGE